MDSFNINVEPQTHNITITKGEPINITVTEEKVVLNKVIETNDINYEGKVIKIDANYPQAIEAARIATEKAEEAKEVVEGFDAHAAEKITEYDANALDKIAAYNANAVEKTNTFNSNASSKTTTFNENANSKTTDFNTNASAKTTAFNDNATSKTNTFNQNATDKTTAFNNNASEKTTAFNDNYTAKKAIIDGQVDLAKDWATKTDGKVDGEDYSAKYYAQSILPIASDITTVAGIASDVTTVSSISSDVTSVAGNATDISTVADNISDVNSVATDILKVTAVADDLTNIDAVNANKTNIDAVAGNNSNITAVANNATNINAVAGNESNINAVNANKTNIDTVASISSDVTTVSGISSDVTSVASNNTDISAVADDLTNIDAVNSNKTNIDAVAGDLTNINAVAGDLTNINNASTYADNANIWAEGSDAQVQALGGVHSSKGWAEVSSQGQVQSNWAETDTTAKSYIQNKPTLGTMASESASDYTKTSGLATVATSGSYVDLSNKPTIPTVTDTYSATSSDGMSGKAVASAISGKANDSDVVNLTGNQTISGTKTFTSQVYYNKANDARIRTYAPNLINGTNPSVTQWAGIDLLDKNGVEIAQHLAYVDKNTGDAVSGQWVRVPGTNTAAFGVRTVGNKTTRAVETHAITPSTSDNSTKIATTAYVKSNLSSKQDTLVSGTNIKTINGSSLLGSGDLTVGGSSRNIGEIVQSTIPLTDAGLHLLDGSLISGSGSYSDFVTFIAGLVSDYPDLFTTEANWQSAVTANGVCDKFVYTSGSPATVRLPKFGNQIYTSEIPNNVPVKGNGYIMQLMQKNGANTYYRGLVTGANSTSNTVLSATYQASPQAYKLNNTNYGAGVGTMGGTYGLGLSDRENETGIVANLSSLSSKSLDCYYYIVVANFTKTQIEVDIDEIATDLNGKADVDLSNCTKPHIVETYVNGTSWYRIYSDGWCEQGGVATCNTSGEGTITFLKPFVNTDYFFICDIGQRNDSSAWHIYPSSNYSEATMYLKANLTGYTLYTRWKACGYIS